MRNQRFFYTLLFIFLLIIKTNVYAEQNDNGDNAFHFLSLSDIHFDPFTACHKISPCPLIIKLRQAPVSQWAGILEKYDTELPHYGQDTNHQLLSSTLTAAKQAAESEHAQFVLVLGDFLGHAFHKQYKQYAQDKSSVGYQAFTKKTLEYIADGLSRAFPTIDIYAVVGNNDSYRGDYHYDHSGRFFEDTSNTWSMLIKDKDNRSAMQRDFPTAGFYTINLPNQPQYKLIVLNSVLFSNNAKGKNVDQAANDQLNWLHRQLELAKTNHQKVFIAMHIPMGTDVFAAFRIRLFRLMELWKEPYTTRFQAELQQFSNLVAGIFAGHLHSDWFQTESYNQNDIPMTGTTAISPVYGNNPGFKIFSYGARFQLKDFASYNFPLIGNKIWDKEYSLNHSCPDCTDTDQNYIDQVLKKFVYRRTMEHINTQSPKLEVKKIV